MAQVSWQYMAGFFDGEGCVGFHKRTYGRYVYVFVSQGHRNETASGVMKEMQAFLAAHGIDASLLAERNRDGAAIVWRLKTSAVKSCQLWLKGMRPYLFVKRAQADHALAAMATVARTRTTAAIRRRIIELRREGLSIKRIAVRLGVAHGTVKHSLIREGVYAPLPRPTLKTDAKGRFVKT